MNTMQRRKERGSTLYVLKEECKGTSKRHLKRYERPPTQNKRDVKTLYMFPAPLQLHQ